MQFSPERFEQIVRTYQSMVYSIALRLLGEPAAAEEVAQDVFLELHWSQSGSRERITSEEHLVYWLRRVTVYRATDHRRRRRLRPEAAAELHAEPWTEAWQEDGVSQAGDSAGLVAREGKGDAVSARLELMLASLPMPLRTVVVLRYGEGMNPSEIAAMLGQPLATTKCNLQRALVLLRRKAETVLKEYVRA